MTEPAGSAPADPAGDGSPTPAASTEPPARPDLTEVVVESEIVRRGRYLTFRVDTVERADGTRAKRDVVGHPGAVAVLAIDPDDRVLMVRQWRSPAGREMLEVPAGTLDVDPATGAVEDHALAARRELEEETGYRAGSWRLLTSFWTAPGFATELMHLYLATDLSAVDGERLGPDEDERLELEHVPWQEAIAAAERGEIVDAKSLVALLWLDRLTAPEPSAEAPAGATADAPAAEIPSAVSVEYVTTLMEYIAASMAQLRGSLSNQVIGLLAIVVGVVAALTLEPAIGVLPILIGLALVPGFLAAPFAMAVWRRQRDLMVQPTVFEASSRGFDFRAAFGHSTLDWSTIRRVREAGPFWFLETGANSLFIPKRAFSPEQLATFRRTLAEAGFGPDGRRRPAT